MAKKLIDLVEQNFEDYVLDSHSRLGNDTVIIDRDGLVDIVEFLYEDEKTKMNFVRDITAVDYLHREPRFEVVYVLYSIEHKHMLLLRVPLAEDDVKCPTISHVYSVASWLEREVYDMYGIEFTDHPDLRRVLLYEEFEGHPLRKDYHTQAAQPRTELLARERDAVEEFTEYVKGEEAAGSRGDDATR
jgi:NADH-quinone oxidoreductase subunit C